MLYRLYMAAGLMLLLFFIGMSSAEAQPPSAYVGFGNQTGSTVDVLVYYKDPAAVFTRVEYATAMKADGGELDWQAIAVENAGGDTKSATIPAAEKYRNYYVRIAKPDLSEISNVRVFPVNTGSVFGTDREFNDYAHGNFRPDTPICGGCHNTHSALKSQLLLKASYYELCMVCHSTANTQSKYDVESGLVAVAGGVAKPSLGGPFVSQAGVETVSRHDANDSTILDSVPVPGSDVLGGKTLGLTCVSCHNGHGGTNDNYRLLKKKIYADDGNSLVTDNINFTGYAITASATSGEELYMINGNTEFCTACHLDYDDGNAEVAGGVYADPYDTLDRSRYRHPVTVGSTVYSVYSVYAEESLEPRTFALYPTVGDYLPLQYNPDELVEGKRTAVVCSTCHYAHGSIRSFNVQDTVYDGKYMLRLDNYGVCESCHKK